MPKVATGRIMGILYLIQCIHEFKIKLFMKEEVVHEVTLGALSQNS